MSADQSTPKMLCVIAHSDAPHYDHSWSTVVCVSFSHTKLEDYITTQTAKLERIDILRAWRRELESQFEADVPAPKYPTLEKVPKFKAGLRMDEITSEMRQHRTDVQNRNQKLCNEYGELKHNWMDRQSEYVAEQMTALGATEEELAWPEMNSSGYSTDMEFTISEIPII